MNRDLFEKRNLIAFDFRHGMSHKKLGAKYGRGLNYTEILLLVIPQSEYDRLCQEHIKAQGRPKK